jgi:DNA ligase-1
LRRITDQFPEVAERAKQFEQELIVDGEIIAFQEGRSLTFFDLQKRLGESEIADLFEEARRMYRSRLLFSIFSG